LHLQGVRVVFGVTDGRERMGCRASSQDRYTVQLYRPLEAAYDTSRAARWPVFLRADPPAAADLWIEFPRIAEPRPAAEPLEEERDTKCPNQRVP